MATVVVHITHGDPATGKLIVEDKDAKRTNKVIWQIAPHSGVDSIVTIVPKTGAPDIWAAPPHPQGNHWEGDVSRTAPFGEYCYAIHWKANPAGPVLIQDPKITIQPDKGLDH